jgi:general secretion pathway protein A
MMRSLSKEKTSAYIDHRIIKAGGTERIFQQEAKDLVHDYTDGVPRQINNVATACLINAAAQGLKQITESLVNETMTEFSLP